jgi:biopolymer transport protein ExbD
MISFQKDKKGPLWEINIIPFTDILLVILVAFMVTTPLLIQSSIKVKLPKYKLNSPSVLEKEQNKLIIAITQEGKIFLNDHPVRDLLDLENKLKSASIQEKIVTVNADQNAYYGIVAKVLSLSQSLGALKLELSIQNEKEENP